MNDVLSVYSAVRGTPEETTVKEVVWRLHDQGRPMPYLDEDYPDVALLRVDIAGPQCVAVDLDWPKFGDHFQSYGFPDEGGAQRLLTPALLSYRGKKGNDPVVFIDLASDTVKPGLSGGPLLNLRTRGVCGIVVATRSPAIPDGGFAVPWHALGDRLPYLVTANRQYHDSDHRWAGVVRQAARLVRFRLPRVVQNFVGRVGELEELERVLDGGSDHAVITQSVTGLGGVGKSQLAAKYVFKHLDAYDIVAWVRAENGDIGDLADLAVALAIPLTDGLTAEERAAAAQRWLCDCNERWLLVLDNVVSPEQVAKLSPTSGNGRVIVTSRHQGLTQFGPVLRIDVLDEDAGEEYLVARTGRQNERAPARRVAAALGGLPLALSHAGAYCSEGPSFEDYLNLLELPAAEIFDTSPEVFYQQTVASTWQVSIEAAADAAPLARPILAMAAYLAPDKIPTTLFERLVAGPFESGLGPRQYKRLNDGLRSLVRFSLVDVQDQSMHVHRLLQKTVRDDADAHNQQTGARAALEAVSAAFPEDSSLPAWWPQCEQLLPHVLVLGDTLGATHEFGPLLSLLLNRCSVYLMRSGATQRAVTVAETAVKVAEHLLGAEDHNRLTARSNLASAYADAGRVGDAVPLLERVLIDRERFLGPDHPDTLTTRSNLASAYADAGRVGDAVPLLERVLIDRECVLGPDHPDTLTSRTNMASCYSSAGRTTEAIALAERVAADSERVLGPDHPNTLTALSNLAYLYGAAGRTTEAIALAERVAADRERVLGPDHRDTLTSRASLASAYGDAGHIREALPALERVVADRERLLGPNHPDTLRARSNLATGYRMAGRTNDATTIQVQVLADTERALGPDHPDTLSARTVLAGSFWSAGRIDDALAIFEQLLADTERVLGRDHPDTLAARSNLATSYESAKRTSDAIAIFEPLVRDSERILGSRHPDTLNARRSLALSFNSANRTDDAIAILEPLIAESERIRGADHPDTLTARNTLAHCYLDAGRTEDAVAMFKQLVVDRERVLGFDHPDTLNAMAGLGSSYWFSGRTGDAVAIFKQAMASSERVLGPDHPDTRGLKDVLELLGANS
jgi:tetratricopeptide (TPR) repeat protein